MNLYDSGEFKVGIYVNNGLRNFQSLNNPRMLHVHVNHGESDKLSSFSNQVKAYDRVFVAGPVAVERYREALIAFDDTKVVAVGRPQLDLELAAGLPASPPPHRDVRPDLGGRERVEQLDLARPLRRRRSSLRCSTVPDVRVIYKPHPADPHVGQRGDREGTPADHVAAPTTSAGGRAVFTGRPSLVGHRGLGRGVVAGHRENTIGSMLAALELGVDWLEVDVTRTRDDALVVRHNPTLDDGRFLVDLTRAEAAAAGVAALDELFDALPEGAPVDLDVKSVLEDAVDPAGRRTAALLAPGAGSRAGAPAPAGDVLRPLGPAPAAGPGAGRGLRADRVGRLPVAPRRGRGRRTRPGRRRAARRVVRAQPARAGAGAP